MKKYFLPLGMLIFILSAIRSQAQTFTSNLPIIKVNTSGLVISDEPKTDAMMQVIDHGPDTLNNSNDTSYTYNGHIGIELRGSSSRVLYDKKSYGVETRDSLGQNLNVSLLGMPSENDWVFYGPFGDKSLLRNVLEYKFSNEMARYASRTRFFELVLNDEYWGIYVLMEKIKRDKNRVDISKLLPDENSGDDLTGGYIVKLDKYDGANSNLGWASPYPPPRATDAINQTIYFQYDYPKNNEISPQQMEYIKQYVTAFENALHSADFNNPITGYTAYADVHSMADYFILNEMSHNVDGYRLSTFLYKDKNSKGGKLFFGPIWDLNLGFGNADYCDGGSYYGWAFQFNNVCNDDYWLVPFWWNRLFYDSNFRKLLSDRWQELRKGPFKTATVLSYIDSTVTAMNNAIFRNFSRWNIIGMYVWPNLFVGNTYSEDVEFLKEWITKRFDWLDKNLYYNPSGIETNPIAAQTVIYPNPFHGRITVDLPGTLPDHSALHIVDLYGKVLWSVPLHRTDKHTLIVWEPEASGITLQPGVYILTLTSGTKVVFSRKLVRD